MVLSKQIKSSWPTVVVLIFHLLILLIKIQVTTPSFSISEDKPEEKRLKVVFKERNKKQIVNTEETGRKEKPIDSKFLGKMDQTFDRQTAARKIDSFKEAGIGVQKGAQVPQLAQGANKKEKSKIKRSKIGKISLADLAIGKNMPVQRMQEGLKKGKAGKVGTAANNDYIRELPLSDMTNLNTTEFKYYGFYFRIRQRLEQHWGASLKAKAEKLYRSGRRIPASSERITSLVVTIDQMGNIVHVHIKGTSGVNELDQAAVESFNRAGPFPNPPKGMLSNGRAQIEWGFVVKG